MMKTLAVYSADKVRRTKQTRRKLKKIGVSIGMGFGMTVLAVVMVLLMTKM